MGWELHYNGTKVRKIASIIIKDSLKEPMKYFKAVMMNPNSTERALFNCGHLEGSNKVEIFRDGVEKFAGFLEAADPEGLNIVLQGRSYEVLLLDERTSRDIEFTNKTGAYILDDVTYGILGKYSTKVGGGIIDFTETLAGTVRFNHDNLLMAIAKTCNIKSKDFWVTYSSPNFFLQVGERGSGSSSSPAATYYGGKDIEITFEKQGVRDLINRIRVFGSGDGINQIQCCVPYIDIDLPDNDRSAGFDGLNTNCEHAAATTSQGTYGIMEGKPHVDRSISSLSNAIETAKTILDDNATLYKNLDIKFSKYISSGVGDWIRILDKKKSLDVTTRIKSIEHHFDIHGVDSIDITVFNPFLSTENQINILDRNSDTANTAGLGATNIFQVQSYENCDATHPLNVRFRLPDDIVQVNKVLLSFNLVDYRAYNTANSDESAHTHALNVWNHNGSYDCGILGTQDIAGEHRMVVHSGGVAPSATAAGSTHTHGVNYGIFEDTLVSPSVDVKAGIDGAETGVGTYTTDQEDIDIVSNISSLGNWYNVEFTPNKAMRIEANVYVKCYIESK